MPLPTFTAATTAGEVADVFAKEIREKNVLITDTSIGRFGFEAARVLAKYANLVIITGYNSERTSQPQIYDNSFLDLSSLGTVRKAAAEVNASLEPLHVLINNAAATTVKVTKLTLTEDNLETQPNSSRLALVYTPRVVIVASVAHTLGTGIELSTVAHGIQINTRLLTDTFKPNAQIFSSPSNYRNEPRVHSMQSPSWNASNPVLLAILTNVNADEDSRKELVALSLLTPDQRPHPDWPWKTIPEGAATTITATFDTGLEAVAIDMIAPHASNLETSAKLWAITEGIIGEKFTL
ncbi:Short-chain dehydrogenase/reductase family protein [Mycena venus]|uniref:Short-chain dehydrogenase/reductase family protein n=1 Tax=Mycena venus TaxID=2733690 RepID=A0A8H6YUU7_9AGAR|nr:Short-chain dehydrogenase/reductase family protein [Mycena venus]